MSELLLEIFSEEIPSRFQNNAAEDLKRLVVENFKLEKLTFEGVGTFTTPRRLTLVVSGIPEGIPAEIEEKRGPRVGSPKLALEGFLKSVGQKENQLQKEPPPFGLQRFTPTYKWECGGYCSFEQHCNSPYKKKAK